MEKLEYVFNAIEIAISFIGLILIIFGWIIPYRQSLKSENIRKNNELNSDKLHWKKELIDRQIENLYGPMYALINESDIVFNRILYQLGRRYVIPKDKSFNDLPETEQKIWKHYVDTYKIKNQMKMVEIMRNNFHLIYKSEFPEGYNQFLDYSLGWELLDNQRRNGVPNYYAYHYVFNYPVAFNRYIERTLKILLDEQAKLMNITEKEH